MAKVLTITLLLFCLFSIYSTDLLAERFDGDTWRFMTDKQKITLVIGYILGQRYMAEVIYEQFPDTIDCINEYGFWDVEAGEIVTLLDIFYSKKANRYIPIYMAASIARIKKEGL